MIISVKLNMISLLTRSTRCSAQQRAQSKSDRPRNTSPGIVLDPDRRRLAHGHLS